MVGRRVVPSGRTLPGVGFSPLGLIVSLAVLTPNLLLVWLPPREPLPSAPVPRPIRWLERAGQACCIVVPAITTIGDTASWWALPAASALVGYYALWGRYLTTGRDPTTLYRDWRGLPVPMALLPVLVFLTSAAWLSNGWIALAALVLAAGHLPAATITARTLAPAR